MITIYSADAATGRLYTDEKKRFYIDSELLQEKARAIRTRYLLDQIAKATGFRSFAELDGFARCSGVTADVLNAWIRTGKLLENLSRI